MQFLDKTKYYNGIFLQIWPKSSSVKAVNLMTKSTIITQILIFPFRDCFYWHILYVGL